MAGNATRSEANQSFFIYVKDTNTGVVKRVAIPGDMQVGLEGRPSELQLFGRLSVSSSTIAVDSTNKGIINVSNNDTVVAVSLSVTPASGRIKAYLPPTPRAGQLHFIKDSSGTAGTVPIDIIPATGVMIDGQASQTLSDAYGSLALVWIAGQWRKLVAGLGASGGSGAPSSASYVTINAESGLTNERHLTGSTNLVMTDNGPNASVYFDLTPVLGGGAGTFAAPTVTVDAWGRITSITAGSVGAPSNASYITVTNEPSLTAERRLTGSFGIKLVDGGANSNIVASFDPTLLIAGGQLSISQSGGNITLSDFDPWVDLSSKIYTTSSVSIDPAAHVATFYGTNVFFYVKGSPRTNTNVAVLGGDAVVSGTLTIGTGSNTAFQAFVLGPDQRTVGITAPGAGSVGAGIQLNAADRINWELLATGDTAFQGTRKFNIRNLTGFSTASFIDALTIIQQGFVGVLNVSPVHALDVGGDVGVSANVFATGSVFSVGGFTGSLTKTIAGLSYLVGAGNVTVTSQSNGQIIISGSGGSGGSGTPGVSVQDEGVSLSASPFTTLNFVGSGVTAVDAGGGIAQVTVSVSGGLMLVTGSALSRRQPLTMLAAMVTTPLASASKANLGIAYFDPTIINKSISTVKYYFRALFGPVLGVGSAYVDLYDYNGIVTGVPAPVAGSVLTASVPGLSRQSVDLSSVFSAVTGSGILIARAWSDPSGSNYCNAGSAALDLEWQ